MCESPRIFHVSDGRSRDGISTDPNLILGKKKVREVLEVEPIQNASHIIRA